MTERKTIEELLANLEESAGVPEPGDRQRCLNAIAIAKEERFGPDREGIQYIQIHMAETTLLLIDTAAAVAELLRRELEWEQTADILGNAARDEENEP